MNESLFYEIKTANIIYQDVIEEIGSQLKKDQYIQSESVFIEEVHEREQHGNIEIFPEVILPHIQSENILKTKIFLIKNETNLMNWHDQSLKLIILLNLKPQEDQAVLQDIQAFMRNLADEDFVESLL
ncbi:MULTISPECIES: PTS sugar transporter subunit IIA [Mammaliicoccus]|uniref:PTS sugar transporter subunit IIA n=1 Tax=Mammaliicoccus sciuri TaxID=1296 RepID=A0ABT7HXW4_MAMSC|nr:MULTISPECIES: PTS sugar transporter subunit IIA [Mammaliicoccus]MCJ0915312.1 PTS sugar transporter subunit IIA [Mammaliicoccus sciuri]MDL0111906.1 PTS sugar transporter subunit IIA [Mammaliicoccus sciuri]MDL0116992.1 PTS sugar transporter subunit IIA [Mammaliicoccus sciuri]WQJ65602.1 PTS sugar transporter subunit IIA [Mammaliicoccus sciuri]